MKPLSILLPTANRPGMLRTALRSIAAQTAVSSIGEVVVIENLGNRESGAVCREFPQLPINYVFRDPPIPPGIDSTRDAMSRIRYDWMAILFDDDWWMERHLEKAMESFTIFPQAVASYAPSLWTTGEEGYWTESFGSYVPWFAASLPMKNERWQLGLADLLVAAQMCTAFHYSSLLVNRDVFNKSLECVADGNPYDTDRLLSVEFSRYGGVVCHAHPQVYTRTHEVRETARLEGDDTATRWWMASTHRLLALAKDNGIDLKSEFSYRITTKSVAIAELRKRCGYGCFEAMVKNGILEPPPTNSEPKSDVSLGRRIYRAMTPPILRDTVSRLRNGPLVR